MIHRLQIMASKKKIDPNTTKLRKLMADNGLKAKDVAAIVRREPITVNIWRCADNRRVIPTELLNLVELTIKASK